MPVRITLVILLLLPAGILFLPLNADQIEDWIVDEASPIQQLSAAGWWIAALGCIITAFRVRSVPGSSSIDWLLGAAILLLFGARELDVQAWLLSWNLEQLHNYWNNRIPLMERVMVLGLLVLPSLSIIIIFAYRMWGRYRQAWRNGEIWTRDFLIWFLMLGGSILLDKLSGLDPSYQASIEAVEETLELSLALFTVLILFPLWQLALSAKRTPTWPQASTPDLMQ